MTRVEDFDSFYRSTIQHALAVTHAISGDRDAAHDAVLTAYRHTWRDWAKVRNRQPLVHLRQEASRAVFLETRTHPIRHRHQVESDKELLDALGALSADSRRLIVLMTIGHADLESASSEVGVSVEEGIEAATAGLDMLESMLGLELDAVERRIIALESIDLADDLPEPAELRRRANVGHQISTIAIVATAVALIVGGGLFVTSGSVFARLTDSPQRERLGAESRDALLAAAGIGPATLLTAKAVGAIDPTVRWTTVGTNADPQNETPYATCPTQRFATDSPVKVMVRTHEAGETSPARIAQSVEVAHSSRGARTAYRQAIQWFADCQHPRVQLVDAWQVPKQDVTILRLVSHRSPARSFTVGFSKVGAVTNTMVHEIDGSTPPAIEAFAATFTTSIARICAATEAEDCPDATAVTRTNPPRTSKGVGFLAVVDLPPMARVDHVWAAVAAKASSSPTRTLCGEPQLSGTAAKSQLFVIPAAGLPETFGVAQTAQRFASEDEAHKQAAAMVAAFGKCAKDNLSARVSRATTFSAGSTSAGTLWQLTFETGRTTAVRYRTAVITRDTVVSQITFTPDGDADLSDAAFLALAKRASQRLTYLP